MSVLIRQINSIGWSRILLICGIIWFIMVLYTALPMLVYNNGNEDVKIRERLARALEDVETLRQQNNELEQLFKDFRDTSLKGDQKKAIKNFQARLTKTENGFHTSLFHTSKDEPNTEYEQLRRRIASNILEFWYFIKAGLRHMEGKSQAVDDLLKRGIEHKRSLVNDIEQLEKVDGFDAWRKRESQDLSDIVQSRFEYLQNPEDCQKAKKLVCNLNKGCGYGCQLHHIAYCFMVAYGTERTMVLKSFGWRYHKGGWEDVFHPISNTCLDPRGETVTSWPGTPETQVLNLPIVDSLSSKPPFLPLNIPEDLAPRLIRLHGDPVVWWVGQILKFLVKPKSQTQQVMQEKIDSLGYQRPIVGVHIRRTDKVGTEAAFHSVEEYMAHVDEYYNQLELKQKVAKRRVYMASDDPRVIKEAKDLYPHYDIIGDPSISQTAAVSNRYSDSSLFGIINDINMLSRSDFLVCTFSSQVCRVAYELMQNYYPDAADRFHSLDDIYYYGGQLGHSVIAVLNHEAQSTNEISFIKGDEIGIAGNHWNGYSKGRNKRTDETGLFPSFKVRNKVETAQFPLYDKVNPRNHDL